MSELFRATITLSLVVIVTLSASAQTDLAPLFAPATPAEIASVRADWAARATPTPALTLVDENIVDGFTVRVVSYDVDMTTLYAAIRFPRNAPVDGPWPVVLLHHGGTDGFDLDYLLGFDVDHPGACLADSAIVAAPTYRSEAFRGQGFVLSRTSGGAPSPFDRDADDAMALLSAVLASFPEADASRVVQWGRSRGANVAWHVALRDPRIRRTAAYFGPTDFRQGPVQIDCQQAVDTGVPALDSLAKRVMAFIVEPWIAGQKNLTDARLVLTSWSVVPFLDAPLSVQVHHGEYDDTVPVQHALAAGAALVVAGADAPEYAMYIYPNGGHTTTSLSGHALVAEPYLCLPAIPTGVELMPYDLAWISAFPNPFQGRVRLLAGVGGDKAGQETTGDIYDLAGRRVVTVSIPADGFVWNGRDAEGRPLPGGTYVVRSRERPQASAKLMLMR